MSIAPLKKVSIAGRLSDRAAVIAALQRFGHLHIIDRDAEDEDVPLQVASPTNREEALSTRSRRVEQAIRFLEQSAQHRRPLRRLESFHLEPVVDEVLSVKERIRELENRRDQLEERVELMRPWGNFRFPPDTLVEHFRLWFYRVPVNQRSALNSLDIPWQIVGRDSRLLYVVLIAVEEPPLNAMPVAREHLGSHSLVELEDGLEDAELALESLYSRREELTRYLDLLKRHKAKADNKSHWRYVMQQTRVDGDLFSLQAWVPVKRWKALAKLARDTGFAVTAHDPATADKPPTLIESMPGFQAGGLLAGFYQIPDYRGWDPSVHLYLSFVLFFSMILSDAGYALLLGAVLLLKWHSMGHSASGLAFRSLARVMVIGATAWGVLAGSYFGFSMPDSGLVGGLLSSLAVIDLNNYDAMMALSVSVGVVHIAVANLSVAWSHQQDPARVKNHLGWAILVVSGLLVWLSGGDTNAVIQVLNLLFWLSALLGAGLVVWGNLDWPSETRSEGLPGESDAPALAWKRRLQIALALLRSLGALANVSKLFGDVLSYMRLFALGLASASLALTFNNLADGVMAQPGGLSLLGGVLILLLGHAVNLALGLMSGVVHGLRLNFIEFYNWSEPGEGYAFRAFELEDAGHE